MAQKTNRKTGLFFGSFNPVHIGHMAIANYMLAFTDIDELWFVVSPQNPLKAKDSLLEDEHRLKMVALATVDEPLMQACAIEFDMPQPNYTIDTLERLDKSYPQHQFVVLMGGDSLANLHRWKAYQRLINEYPIYVYQRPNNPTTHKFQGNIKVFDAPLLQISATFIRQSIADDKNMRYFLPPQVWDYIVAHHFYKT